MLSHLMALHCHQDFPSSSAITVLICHNAIFSCCKYFLLVLMVVWLPSLLCIVTTILLAHQVAKWILSFPIFVSGRGFPSPQALSTGKKIDFLS